MPMRLQAVQDPVVDQNFRQIESQFPIQAETLAKSAKELFPQLAETAERKIAFGTATFEWAGGTKISKKLKITHGLGASPSWAGFMPNTEGGAVLTFSYFSKTSTTFEVWAGDWFETPVVGAKFTCDWIAIG